MRHELGSGAAVTDRCAIDLRPRPNLEEIEATLGAVAADLRALWTATLDNGDFYEVDRLVEASHAVHRAVVALNAGALGARTVACTPVDPAGPRGGLNPG
jgi:hypothetical protein